MTTADAVHRKSGALARGWRDFRRWRRGRPFWAGLFTLLSGLLIYGSTQLSLSGFQLRIGLEGFLTYVIPLVLLLCGLLIWLMPQHRVFYGVIAAVVALYSLIGVNFGGFFFGMLFGVIGGSLAIAWTPVKPAPPAEEAEEPDGGPAAAGAAPGEVDEPGQPEATVDELFTGPLTDVLPPPVNPLAEPAQSAQPAPGAHRYEDEEQWPDGPPPRSPQPGRGNGTGPLPRRTPRLFVITLVPLLLTAFAIAGVHGGTPARAAEPYPSPCPATTKSARAKPEPGKSSAASRSPAGEPGAEVTRAAGPTKSPAAGPSPSASPSPTSTEDSDGLIGGLLGGIGDLLGIGGEATPSPSASASPTATGGPATGRNSTGPTPRPEATPSSAKPTKSASATPKPAPSADCVVVDPKEHTADGVPVVQKVPDRMQGTRLTLHGFAFDGVTELNTAGGGTIRVLEFSMSSAVTENFKLSVPGPGEHTTVLTSSALTVRQASGDDGRRVKFYCSEFTGKLVLDILGVPLEVPIPLTFTPGFPPPLTFDTMVFTDIDIQLVFVDTDVLLAPDLNNTIQG